MGRRATFRWLVPGLLAGAVLGGCGSGPAPSAGIVARSSASTSTTATSAPDESVMPPSTASSTPTSSTTSTTPTTSTTAPAAATPSWHLTGQHLGIEHFQLYTGRCAFLDHHLQETFTVSDGGTWSFVAEYCGTIDDTGMWTGVGTFDMTTGTGSGFSGTFTDSAQLPSVGVPYVLNVESGSGDLAGASGTCALDNHLREIEFGVQEQSGTFVCDLHG